MRENTLTSIRFGHAGSLFAVRTEIDKDGKLAFESLKNEKQHPKICCGE